MILERPNLSCIHVPPNIAPLRDAAGLVYAAVNIFQDITEIKSGEREREQLVHDLERSNRELSRFCISVSHALRAPVRGIRALTQILVSRNEGPTADTSHLAQITDQAAEGIHMPTGLPSHTK